MSGFQKLTRYYRSAPQLFLAVSTLLLLSIACNLPLMAKQETGDQEQPPGYIETSIIETMDALGHVEQDPAAPVEPEQDPADPVEPEQDPPPPPSATFTPENTATPTLTPTITETPTPEFPLVYVSENTNCRTGPGKVYDWLTTINQGEELEVVAKDPLDQYWYIRRPDQPSEFCWLWGKYATPSGDTASLPVYTPIPTPTPSLDFTVSYISKTGPCPKWGLLYRVNNVGGVTLQSWKTTAVDHTGGSNPEAYDEDDFQENVGCAIVSSQLDLTPGESHYVWASFNGNPTGHDITTTIKICSKNGLGGDCITRKIRHTP